MKQAKSGKYTLKCRISKLKKIPKMLHFSNNSAVKASTHKVSEKLIQMSWSIASNNLEEGTIRQFRCKSSNKRMGNRC